MVSMTKPSATCLALSGEKDLRPARRAVRALAESLPFDERQVADITLAVAEACVNSVRHGRVEGVDTSVCVTAAPDADHLAIEVQDNGSGFEAAAPCMPTHDAESGRGIALIYALMDDVEIRSTRSGTRVRMLKYFSR